MVIHIENKMHSFTVQDRSTSFYSDQDDRVQDEGALESEMAVPTPHRSHFTLSFTPSTTRNKQQRRKINLNGSVRRILFGVTPLGLTDPKDSEKIKPCELSRCNDLADNNAQHTLNGSYDYDGVKISCEKQDCDEWSPLEPPTMHSNSSEGNNFEDSTRAFSAKVSLLVTNMRKNKIVRRRLNFNLSIESSCDNSIVKKLSFTVESCKGDSAIKSYERNVELWETSPKVSMLQQKKVPLRRRLSFSSPSFSEQNSKELSCFLAAAITSEAIASAGSSLTPKQFQIDCTTSPGSEKGSPLLSNGPPRIRTKQRVRSRLRGKHDSGPKRPLPRRLKFTPVGGGSFSLLPNEGSNNLTFLSDSPAISETRLSRENPPQMTFDLTEDHLSEYLPDFTEPVTKDSSTLTSLDAVHSKRHQKLIREEPLMYIYRDPEPGSTAVPSPMPVYRPSQVIPEAKAVLPKACPNLAPVQKKKKRKRRSELPLHPMLFQLIRQSAYHKEPWDILVLRSKISN